MADGNDRSKKQRAKNYALGAALLLLALLLFLITLVKFSIPHF